MIWRSTSTDHDFFIRHRLNYQFKIRLKNPISFAIARQKPFKRTDLKLREKKAYTIFGISKYIHIYTLGISMWICISFMWYIYRYWTCMQGVKKQRRNTVAFTIKTDKKRRWLWWVWKSFSLSSTLTYSAFFWEFGFSSVWGYTFKLPLMMSS